MKNKNKKPIMVGIFVLVALILFVTAIFTLGGQQSAFAKTVRIYAVFTDVAGLKPGNNVWFSGVKIGTIKEIKFHGNSDVEVAMNIQADAQNYIRKDAKVMLSSDGFIGNKLIEIVGGTQAFAPVENGDKLEVKQVTG
ncbi:MAG: MlaD family protein, partial [Bacteroidota bacterium]|nr:MlaD family protein [Bacteroidota bacterium]